MFVCRWHVELKTCVSISLKHTRFSRLKAIFKEQQQQKKICDYIVGLSADATKNKSHLQNSILRNIDTNESKKMCLSLYFVFFFSRLINYKLSLALAIEKRFQSQSQDARHTSYPKNTLTLCRDWRAKLVVCIEGWFDWHCLQTHHTHRRWVTRANDCDVVSITRVHTNYATTTICSITGIPAETFGKSSTQEYLFVQRNGTRGFAPKYKRKYYAKNACTDK